MGRHRALAAAGGALGGGARYFYLPAIGVAWFAAGVLAHTRVPVRIAVAASRGRPDRRPGLHAASRRHHYQARLAAARRAVADGVAHGADTFHVAAGIKDLDLAVKEDRPVCRPRVDAAGAGRRPRLLRGRAPRDAPPRSTFCAPSRRCRPAAPTASAIAASWAWPGAETTPRWTR